MDFGLTEEQRAFRGVVRRFAAQEVAPVSRLIDGEEAIPADVLTGLAKLGVLGMSLPVEEGGLGASAVDMGIATEELARADFVVGQMPVMAGLVSEALRHAEPATRAAYLPALLEGTSLVGFALTEPGSGSDAMAMTCVATRTTGGYRLTGEKTSVSNLGHAEACIVLARTDGGEVTAFLVPLAAEGVDVALFRDLGSRGLSRGSLSLREVAVAEDHVLGGVGRGFQLVMHIFDLTRTLIGLSAVATATASLEDAVRYVRERTSFGVPIAAHQGVSFPITEHATRLEAARWLCYRALWLRDQGLPHTSEAAMCKWWCVVTAREAIHEMMLLHGHGGYTEDLPHEQRLRDVIGMEWGDGTAQIQKLVIARSLIGREAVHARAPGPGARQ